MKTTILIPLVLFLLTACTKGRDSGVKEFYHFSPERIASFDPIQVSDTYSAEQTGKVYEGLFEFHPFKRPYVLVPNLAESMPEVSKDNLTYTFQLKKGVRFQDDPAFPEGKGRELTADDLIYSLKRLADPKLLAKGWWLLDERIEGLNTWREKYADAQATNYQEEVSGLKKIDSHTVAIKLTKPFPQLLYALAMSQTFIVAKEAVEHYGTEFLNHPVGTGPYILKTNNPNRLVFERNPNFREKLYPSEGEPGDAEAGLLKDAGKKLPLLDRIIVDIIVESQPRWMNFRKGRLDLMNIPNDNFQQAIGEDQNLRPELQELGMILSIHPMLDVTYIAFNHELALFKNKKLRRAMSLAYNRELENKLFYQSTGLLAQGPIPPGLAGYDKDLVNPWVKHDLTKARQLLKEAGYPDGKGLPEITLDTTSSTQARQQSEYFARNMAELGIKIKVNVNTWPELVKKVHNNQHQLYPMGWLGDYPDAQNFLSLLYCPNKNPGSNGANYCNPEFDKLFEKANLLQDSPERTALYEKMNAIAADDVPWLFALHRTRHYVRQGWVKNYKYMEFNHTQFQYLDVDTEQKAKLESKF